MPQLLGEDARVSMTPPHGLSQIIARFGDIFAYIRPDHSLDPRWSADFLQRITLPFPLTLSWDHSRSITQVTCHKLIAEVFTGVFARIESKGLKEKITSFGGCFSFRPKRTGSKLSTHAWGIAIDLNPESNTLGTAGDMDPAVTKIFQDAGFQWGGDWRGRTRDPMHFQFCTGY